MLGLLRGPALARPAGLMSSNAEIGDGERGLRFTLCLETCKTFEACMMDGCLKLKPAAPVLSGSKAGA